MKSLSLKLIAIAILCMAFMVGMLFVSGLVSERQHYHNSVIDEIKEAHVDEQYLTTPFLVVQTNAGNVPIFPSKSDLSASINAQDNQYQRGIYHAISYESQVQSKQIFSLAPLKNLSIRITPSQNSSQPKTPIATALKLIVGISDLRGAMPSTVQINNKSYPLTLAGDKTDDLPFAYLQADISDQLASQEDLTVTFKMPVLGIGSINLLPLGDEFSGQISSNWQEPKFFGKALPIQKTINQQGFHAIWRPNFIAKENQKLIYQCLTQQGSECATKDHSNSQWLGTAFVKMDDTYAQTDRTIKYALLLALICFGTFFLFETIKGLRIHPIQYSLVGGALLVFYVLLLSLAEHIAFIWAYTIASLACVGLIGWYTCYILAGIKRGLGFALVLALLYAGFYVVLSISGFNLLLGAIFCFVLLAGVMYITRHIDWYHLHNTTQEKRHDK